MKKVLLLGARSYVGTSFQTYIQENYAGEMECVVTSLRGEDWKGEDWSVYDCVINVTGKAHADIGSLTEQEKQEYYEVNCRLACAAAEKTIAQHVGQYIYFSSIIVYGDSACGRKPVVITKDAPPAPSNFYGDSKWQAEQELEKLFQSTAAKIVPTRLAPTKLVVVRSPMIYGKGCKGNYRTLEKMAEKLPVFPNYPNQRSMLYIGNLCEFLYLLIKDSAEGLYFPQNREYVKTAELVALLGERKHRQVHLMRILNPFVSVGKLLPGKIGSVVRKAFGSLVYDSTMSDYGGGAYQKYSLRESVEME